MIKDIVLKSTSTFLRSHRLPENKGLCEKITLIEIVLSLIKAFLVGIEKPSSHPKRLSCQHNIEHQFTLTTTITPKSFKLEKKKHSHKILPRRQYTYR